MCGIVGAMSSWLSPGEIDRFRELMMVSNLRGRQGAGVISVAQSGKVDYLKVVDNGIAVCDSPDFDEMVNDTKDKPSILIGHTRWPTKGNVDLDGTHPHDVGDIIGVHNGTMERVMGKWVDKSQSDSLLLYQAIQEHGVDEAIKQSKGAYALLWVDTRNGGTFNILKNSKRTLYFATCQAGNTIFWASEADFLRLVLGRQNWKFDVHAVPDDKLITFDFKVGRKQRGRVVREIKPVEVAYSGTPFRGSNGVTVTRGGSSSPTSSGSSTSTSGTATTQEATTNVVHIKDGKPVSNNKEADRKLLETITPQLEALLKKQREEAAQKSEDEARRARLAAMGIVYEKEDENRDLIQEYFDQKKLEQAAREAMDDDYAETVKGCHVHRKVRNRLLEQGCAYCGTIKEPDDNVHWFARHEFVCEDCIDDDWVIEFLGDKHPQAKTA